MQPVKIICTQCGAVIPPGEAVCPYCGSAYAPEAERAYMRKLGKVRSDLDRVGETGAVESRKEIGRLRKRIVRILVVILLIIGGLYGFFRFNESRDHLDNRQEYLWRQENLPELNRLYEEGKYDELIEACRKAMEEDHSLYEWEHYAFCEFYEESLFMKETLKARERGIFQGADAITLLYQELKFRGLQWRTNIPDEDRKVIEDLYAPFEGDLQEIFQVTEDDLAEFDRRLKEYDGYPDFKQCEEYIRDHPQILLKEKN